MASNADLSAMRKHCEIEGNGTPFYMIENVPDLGSERTELPDLMRDLDQFVATRAPGGAKAIVLDTLARCMGEADENSARDMGRFVNRCRELEQHYGCAIVVVHHVGKDAKRGGRGSNALNAPPTSPFWWRKQKDIAESVLRKLRMGLRARSGGSGSFHTNLPKLRTPPQKPAPKPPLAWSKSCPNRVNRNLRPRKLKGRQPVSPAIS